MDPVERYHEYTAREFPDRLARLLDEELRENSMTLGDHVKALILGVVEKCHAELFQSYRARSSSLPSPSDATSETAIGQPHDVPQQTPEDPLDMDLWSPPSTEKMSMSEWVNNTLLSAVGARAEAPEKKYYDNLFPDAIDIPEDALGLGQVFSYH
jgi:hypothetical protein